MSLPIPARIWTTLKNAFLHFNTDDGPAIASHLALGVLLAIFPFLLVVSGLVTMFGDQSLTDDVLEILFEGWPVESAVPIREQLKIILANQSSGFFSISSVVALVLASNGIEAARVGLNRAYRVTETRSFLWTRVQGLVFIILGAIALISLALVLVAAPLVWQWLMGRFEELSTLSATFDLVRYALAVIILFVALLVFHLVLPAGRRSVRSVLWGIGFTTIAMIAGSNLFAIYIATFANYTALYAGLAGIMITIIYLYVVSVLFLFGAELNAEIAERSGAGKPLKEDFNDQAQE